MIKEKKSLKGKLPSRRKFFKAAAATGVAAVAASSLAAPAVAADRVDIAMVTTWPRDFPGLGTSAQRLAARITELSQGALTTEYFAAGEKVGAFSSWHYLFHCGHTLCICWPHKTFEPPRATSQPLPHSALRSRTRPRRGVRTIKCLYELRRQLKAGQRLSCARLRKSSASVL